MVAALPPSSKRALLGFSLVQLGLCAITWGLGLWLDALSSPNQRARPELRDWVTLPSLLVWVIFLVFLIWLFGFELRTRAGRSRSEKIAVVGQSLLGQLFMLVLGAFVWVHSVHWMSDVLIREQVSSSGLVSARLYRWSLFCGYDLWTRQQGAWVEQKVASIPRDRCDERVEIRWEGERVMLVGSDQRELVPQTWDICLAPDCSPPAVSK